MIGSFNDKAHEIVGRILEIAEDRAIAKGLCRPEQATNFLALDYIKTCADFLEHGTQYLASDERIGADLFLAKLPKGRLKARFDRDKRICASQLAAHTFLYFPSYATLLRLAYLHVLTVTTDLETIRRSGLLMLAAASLPGVRTDIRRALRQRGATWDRTIASEAIHPKGIQ